eukprot:5123980-Pyramimonas_sp.AAC.1
MDCALFTCRLQSTRAAEKKRLLRLGQAAAPRAPLPPLPHHRPAAHLPSLWGSSAALTLPYAASLRS